AVAKIGPDAAPDRPGLPLIGEGRASASNLDGDIGVAALDGENIYRRYPADDRLQRAGGCADSKDISSARGGVNGADKLQDDVGDRAGSISQGKLCLVEPGIHVVRGIRTARVVVDGSAVRAHAAQGGEGKWGIIEPVTRKVRLDLARSVL